LAVLLPDLVNSNPALRKVLHFAPEPVLESALRKQDIEYRTSDLYLQDVDLPGEDLQHLSLPSRSYDLVLCNHVLEHVADDDKAVSEIARILKPSGIAVITIPGDWTRSHTVVFPDQRLNGHYRDYGMDAKKLFLRHFANVRVVDMHVFDRLSRRRRRAIRRHDLVFICQTSM
jgi:2-polyprenyl-3-methyl-5-hydroxy-6-metoxy-1,4-benzoquinol methylase